MEWIFAIVVVGSLVALKVELARVDCRDGWRGQAEGLRQRWNSRNS